MNVVIAIVSNAWIDSVQSTREVFWKSRIDVLFQHSYFDDFFTAVGVKTLFHLVDNRHDSSAKDHDSSAKKSVWNIVVSIITNIFLFVLGLLTLGLFWPAKLRRRILSAGINYN